MPSVLVETGFLTNKDEGAYLNSVKGQNEIGSAIAKAILHYKEGVKPTVKTVETTIEKSKSPPIKEEVAEKTEKNKGAVIEPSKGEIAELKKKQPIAVPAKVEEVKEELENTVVEAKPEEVISSKEVVESIIFKIQLMASSKNVQLTSANFNGLSNLSQEPYKNLYRYMYGETRSYREAKMMQTLAQEKGYKTAYIVAYKFGERIPIKQALDEVSEFTP